MRKAHVHGSPIKEGDTERTSRASPNPVQIHPDPLSVNKHVKALSNAAGMAETISTPEPTS